LDLSSNAFAIIPPPVLRLPSLRALSLAGNRIASLPSDWGVLKLHLEELDIRQNKGAAPWSGEAIKKKFQCLKELKLA
jgi:Leucine-rich repeat (LRR) protein